MVPRRNWKKGPFTGKLQNLSEISWFACVFFVGVGWFCVVLFEGKSPLKKCLNTRNNQAPLPHELFQDWSLIWSIYQWRGISLHLHTYCLARILFTNWSQNTSFQNGGNFPITGCHTSTLTLNSERVFCDQFVMEEWQTIWGCLGLRWWNFELKFGQ